MSRSLRVVLGGLGAVGVTVLLAGLSRAPQRVHGTDAGLLRLSWSGQPERIEVCRAVPEAELENLPRHMRQAVVCEGRSASYQLTVVQDGDTLLEEPVWGGGVRHDRPVYLYREFVADPGTHHLIVRFTRLDEPSSPNPPAADSAPERPGRGRLDRLPSELLLDTAITVRPRQVVLVTFDPAERGLVVRTE
jgi:hypothetical protein